MHPIATHLQNNWHKYAAAIFLIKEAYNIYNMIAEFDNVKSAVSWICTKAVWVWSKLTVLFKKL